MRALFVLMFIVHSFSLFAGERIVIEAGPNIGTRIQEAMIVAKPGTTIELPEGHFQLTDELMVAKSHITIRGKGMKKTKLDFKGQEAGAQGILATGDQFVIEDLAVLNAKGDAVKVEGANGVVFRRLWVEWTDGPKTENGGYGLYPVQTKNVLIEDNVVIGASDAGVYVGQSRNIIVRRNRAEYNVAGIEIENSQFADVYDNVTTNNTAGILVFDLPNLKFQGGRRTRVFQNEIYNNNHKNFAPKGNIVGIVPRGTGMMIMANDDIEVFGNRIYDHKLTSIAIINYHMAQIPIRDPNYDPLPQRIYIHDNVMDKKKRTWLDGQQINFVVNMLFWFKVPQITYDGIDDGTYNGEPFPDDMKICIRDNYTSDGGEVSFGNMHIDNQRRLNPIPGGPVTRDASPHDCAHDPLPAIVLDKPIPVPATLPDIPSDIVKKMCNASVKRVNWAAALAVNCEKLSNYNIFKDNDPRGELTDRGTYYDLTTPLFSDYAEKDRYVLIPPGFSATYSRDKNFNFPIGTILTKTFSYLHDKRKPKGPRKVVETRLLIKRIQGWVALPYIWNEEMTEATLSLGGGEQHISWRDLKGKKRSVNYKVPSLNKCLSCHQGAGGAEPIGPKAKWLNRDLHYASGTHNQLEKWSDEGLLQNLPVLSEKIPSTPVWENNKFDNLEKRAKAYLDINCAHCHNPTGRARFSGLFLENERDAGSAKYGTCKPPIAAGVGSGGREFDIVPGKPKDSILVYRIDSVDPAIRMPELGRGTIHKEGLKLVEKWIKKLPKQKCSL